ncbi:MAG: diaminopimelate epimerase [Deltaproteobacteria bacterium]|nr:diaminopimelate epimerase [Deltaproteobacteria bacterium]
MSFHKEVGAVGEKGDQAVVFSKMSGHGNDFIVMDGRTGEGAEDWRESAREWCMRRTSIGADGLLIVEPSTVADFKMRIFNADGSEAEMCGNGARCVAAFAVREGIAQPEMVMETLAGPVRALVRGDMVAIQLTDPSPVKDGGTLEIDGENVPFYFINSGVPHTIIFREKVAAIPPDKVARMGHEVRFHPVFSPEGTNVNFVEVLDPGRIRVRTYERGVEAETLACGTGAVASSIVSSRFRKAGFPPIQVEMPGGTLIVDFKDKGDSFEDVWLKGKVVFVYEGTMFP